MGKLDGKYAIVTGAAKGIGAAVVKLFVKEGAAGVAIFDYDEETAQKTAEEAGGNIKVFKCDISNSDMVKECIEGTLEAFGRIDILVNNAGITKDAMFHKMTDDQWNRVIDINLNGTYNCTKFVAPLMREQKYGKIVNIASSSAYGNAGQANYSATKAGIIGFTKTLCKELAGRNVTVNAIAPANIATDMLSTIPDHLKAMAMMISPAHRYGTPEELANTVLFLSSDDSSYVNGIVLDVNGGMFT